MKNRIWIILIVILVLLLATPILIFAMKFGNNILSEDITLWAAFGDYFGGILNTIISLFSLIILTYITILVSRLTSKENKDLYILERKMEAYEELTKFFSELNLVPRRLDNSLSSLIRTVQAEQSTDPLTLQKGLNEIRSQVDLVFEYHFFLFGFNVRYSHLFEYDFQSENYMELIRTSKIFREGFDSYHKSLADRSDQESNIQELFDNHMIHLTPFINALRDEIRDIEGDEEE